MQPPFLLLLAALASAKTDLQGCTSSETVAYGGASYIFWVPGTGEVCSFLDCGGGRAPPKTTVPGCAQYSGTATYSPHYLPGYGGGGLASSTTAVMATSTRQSSAVITGSSTSTSVAQSSSEVQIVSLSSSGSGSVSSAVITTSSGANSGTQVAVSTSGTISSRSSSSSSTSSAPVSSATGNSAVVGGNGFVSHGVVGAVAAAFAFML